MKIMQMTQLICKLIILLSHAILSTIYLARYITFINSSFENEDSNEQNLFPLSSYLSS